jgi:glucosamine kinase
MMLEDHIVIGIDGGGTHTRVMVCDLYGNMLSYIEKGAASIYKDSSATLNVQNAIVEALEKANKSMHQVLGVAAGIAGYDTASDLEWIVPLTDIPGLSCPKWHVNDAVVAHYGALMTKPGIVVISGTGSIILGITEDGQYLRNYDFHHYAASAARFIAYDAVYEILAGNTNQTDDRLIQSMQEHWNVQSLNELFNLARKGFADDRQDRDRIFGHFTPMITEAAKQGSSVAVRVCDRAISQIKVGIELLASSFSNDTVNVTFIGSVVNTNYFIDALSEQLIRGNNRQFTVVKPKFPPVTGAVLLAMNRLNLSISEDIIHNLHKSEFSQN